MKYLRKIGILVLALVLGVMPLCAPAALAETDFVKNEWVVLSANDMIYKDAALTKEFGTAPSRMLVKLFAVRDGVGAIVNGRKVGYVSLKTVSHLSASDKLVTKKNTLAFKKPNTNSKSVQVPKGTEFELEAVAGNCAKVVKNGVTAYISIKHCKLMSAE